MWASINIQAGSVTTKGFTSITAAPLLQKYTKKKYMWNMATVCDYYAT